MMKKNTSPLKINQLPLLISFLILTIAFATPALAHHPMEGQIPTNFFEGFMSGLAHPVIGLDHFAFIVATGCFATLSSLGLIIPTGFVVASLIGTGIHLMNFDLPYVETIIAISVLTSGIILAQWKLPPAFSIIPIALVGGIFHGFAYGEAIIGAEMTPLLSYLVGFSLIQWLIAFVCYKLLSITKNPTQSGTKSNSLNLRFVGFALCGVGLTFLTTLIA